MFSKKPWLSLWQILSMNFGFFGIQYSFGLQQANMSPIYKYLGAEESSLPLLWLAGPMTGLIVQPLIGAMSDSTTSRWGRRTPYFLIGAVLCSLGLLLMPYSPTLWFAASLLWILDTANNVTMEPYRAYVSDRLDPGQHTIGFLTQSAFTGLAQTLAYLTPTLLVLVGIDANATGSNHVPQITLLAFLIGAVFSITTVAWSVYRIPELPLSPEERERIGQKRRGWQAMFREISDAVIHMPGLMRRLWWMKLFQWYAMSCYWIYVVPTLALSLFNTRDGASQGFRDASLLNGQIGGFYNAVAFVAALALIPFSRRFGAARVHSLCLCAAGISMLLLPSLGSRLPLFLCMIGIGLAWASIMGNPYIMLAGCIPPERAGIYMGIFNMFIVIPMIIQMLTVPLLYNTLLGGDPRHVLELAGVFLFIAAGFAWRLHRPVPQSAPEADDRARASL